MSLKKRAEVVQQFHYDPEARTPISSAASAASQSLMSLYYS